MWVTLTGVYAEGFAGNIVEEGVPIGLTLSNVETGNFKAGLPLGTWAAGLGGNTVKASTEHYVVMQNVLSDQMFPDDPDAVYPLDNNLIIIGGVNDGRPVTDVIDELQALYDMGTTSVDVFPADAPDGVIDIRDVLVPNENTIGENIAASSDYSVTLKDDGKLLYRWGTIVKRPTDFRFRAELALPEEWKTPDAAMANGGLGYHITSAQLILNHAITNNPNDQIRPEDLENEAATGRTPTYVVIQHPDHLGDADYALWVSPVNDFSGDGTYYPSYFKLDANGDIITTPESGDVVALTPGGDVAGVVNTDAFGDPVGTVFREVRPDNYASSTLLSSDLTGGYTNAWYTTMDRDPFEAVLDGNGDYIVGPRWRMQSGKFGQDLPSVDIPLIPHSEPPFQKDNIKYETGVDTTTTINLLDWISGEDSPLAYSNGWTMTIPGLDDNMDGVSNEGLRLSDNFDIAFYVKGDIKPARIYNVQLVLTWEADFALDFGDAPDESVGFATGDYQTTLFDDGPRHKINPNIMMGAAVDDEPDALQNADATGDDLTSTDDEDGLVDPVGDLTLAIGSTPTVDVNVTNTTGVAATLLGWIDYNNNGNFEALESASMPVPDGVTGGVITLTFPQVPSGVSGSTFARFRLTTDSAITTLTPGGLAEDGEVEDYVANFLTEGVIAFDGTSGDFFVGHSDSSQFSFVNGPNWDPAEDWKLFAGDFNGDGLQDVAGYRTAGANAGRWQLGLSNGTTLVTTNSLAWNSTSGWVDFQVGDYNGDGKDDVAARNAVGQWWMVSGNGTGFDSSSLASWNATGWVGTVTGDFNNDNVDDIAGLDNAGQWWVGFSNGTQLLTSYAGKWTNQATAGWHNILSGDFNADGKADVVAQTAAGKWYFGTSTGSVIGTLPGSQRFVITAGNQWSTTSGFGEVLVGDFNGDGRDDLTSRNALGQWWVQRLTPSTAVTEFWGSWGTTQDWTALVGDFNGDGRDDIAGVDANSGSWYVSVSQSTYFQQQFFGSSPLLTDPEFVGSGRLS